MKDGWSNFRLGDLCSFENGDRGKNYPGRKAFVASGVPFINAGHLNDGEIDWQTMDFIPKERFDLLGSGKVQEGDILFCLRGSLGKFGIVDRPGEGAIASSLVVVRPDQAQLSLQYLARYFESSLCAKMISKFENGAAQPNLSSKSLKNFEIPLPPLEEQKRIVAVLDEAFAALDRARIHAEINLRNARELFEAALLSIFVEMNETPEMLTLKQVSIDFSRGKSKHRPRNDKTLYGGEYPFIQTGDVRNCDHVISSYTQTYNEKGLSQSKLWPKGTVCITIAANIAETGILGFDACFPDSIIGAIPNEERTSADYLEYLLQFFQARLQARGEGSAQANINLRTFETEFFPFPPLETQRRMISNLGAISKHVENLSSWYERKILEIDDLRQSLLQRAFAGELT